ncbi:hypothetical protein [Silvibacterium dinghuense]|nr:hypothetical protein [Silvibacterium dinghuense]
MKLLVIDKTLPVSPYSNYLSGSSIGTSPHHKLAAGNGAIKDRHL